MCLDVNTVRRWTRRSREENPSESTVHDQARTGRPLSASDSKHQSRVDQLIRENRRVKQIDISRDFSREGPPHHHKSPRIQESFCSMGPKNADASDEAAKSCPRSFLRSFCPFPQCIPQNLAISDPKF